MRIHAGEVEYFVRMQHASENTDETVVFLHGMTLSSRDWEPVLDFLPGDFTCVAPDFIGHGNSEAPDQPEHYRLNSIIKQITEVIDHLGQTSTHWVGYSMGGRILLHWALRNPERVRSLVLESTTAGLEDSEDRKKRRTKDHRLAELAESEPFAKFVDRWMNASIFESQRDLPHEKLDRARDIRLSGDPVGYAHCLRELGRGTLVPVWKRLESVDIPTLLISGEQDPKHVHIHERLHRKFENSTNISIEGAGHNVHFEFPELFVEHLQKFLETSHN